MPLVVQKFGGTSVATSEHIRRVAARIAATRQQGDDVIAVVSAMGSTTDEFIQLAADISSDPPAREMDMLLTAGERISMALLAMALSEEGIDALSLTGSQAGILTEGEHGSAEIHEVRSFRVQEGLDAGKVVIVAGFQGVDPSSKDVTTLGRGGSDVTAVALAAAHRADVCEIYTDVDGIFTADPKIVPEARLLEEVSFDEMLELAASGAAVLMARAVEVGRRRKIPIHVRSSFGNGGGTWIRERTAEQMVVRGIAQGTENGDGDSASVAVVGEALRSAPAMDDQVRRVLIEVGIEPGTTTFSECRLSCFVRREDAEEAVRALHAAFDPPMPISETA